jgi:general secretion pathway protein G
MLLQILAGKCHRMKRCREAGMTLVELLIACAIVLVLSSAALPIARHTVLRNKENALRADLLEMRQAIDRYKEACDLNRIRSEIGTQCYPPDLETLVKGVALSGGGSGGGSGGEKVIRFLRKIPTDPMTGRSDWGLRSVQDDFDSLSWGGKDVYDVYSRSQGTGRNGTKYSDW